MRKSKYIFVIIAVIYLGGGFFNCVGTLKLVSNLFAALSITALSLSIGDVFAKIGVLLFNKNLLKAEMRVAIDFLRIKIKMNEIKSIIPRNVVENIKMIDPTIDKYTFIHPIEYNKKLVIKLVNFMALLMFIIGIAVFIFLPLFEDYYISEKVVASISVFAFSSMMLGMFIDEKVLDIQEAQNNMINEKFALIRTSYKDFDAYHINHFNLINDLRAHDNMDNVN